MARKMDLTAARIWRWSALGLACMMAAGCANVQPVALTPQDSREQIQKDAQAVRKDVEPIQGPLTLDEAMARALKYNLDRRSKMMEEALAMGQLDVSKLPHGQRRICLP